MPLKPKMIMDEDEEEVTRKIAPAMIMPSLRPLPTMPTVPTSMMTSPTFRASPMKATRAPRKEQRTPFSWKLYAIPALPEFHVLERTATFVPNAMPAEVASRISDVLRERSIEAQYESGKAKVKCTTAEGVDFRIRLYRGRGRYNHGIIVEVQRRFGTSFVFHSDTQAILSGARGEVPSPPEPQLARGNVLPEVSESDEDTDLSCGVSYQVPSTQSSLTMVEKMMKLSGFDSQYLGLQMLSPLVDSERLTLSTAKAVASRLFDQDCDVGEKVLDYVINNKKKTRSRSTKRGALDDDDEDDNDSSIILRNASLNILSNAIKACGMVPESRRGALRTALLRDLNHAEEHPNTAFLASKCLEFFIQNDQDNQELKAAFQFACSVGESRHANLMHQAQKCMSINDAIIR